MTIRLSTICVNLFLLIFVVTSLASQDEIIDDDNGPPEPSTAEEDEDGNVDNDDLEGSSSNESSCSVEGHAIIDGWTTCCNHTMILQHGIDVGKFWKECAKRPPALTAKGGKGKKTKTKTDQESYVNATRRVYACILKKYLKKSVVTLVDFTKVMTTNYPEQVKSKIMSQAKKHSLQKRKETSLSNYEGVREIRNTFFEIQKTVCIALNPNSASQEVVKKSESSKTTTCHQWEEAERNGGTCCKGHSVPLNLDMWHVPILHNQDQCNATLNDLFQKWKIQEQAELEAALDICTSTCQLRQQGVLSSSNVETMHIQTRKELMKLVRQIGPPFLSQTVLQDLLTYTSAHNDTTSLEDYYSKMYYLTNDTITALRPCIITQRLADIVFDGLHSHCFPQQSNDDSPKVKQ